MPYHFRNLVFEGGGVKGIAYLGAMQVLEEKGIVADLKRVGGTSVGAINALLLALGYGNEEQRKILWQMDFKNFLDSSWLGGNVMRVLHKYGWYKGDFFRAWVGRLISDKMGRADVTFQDLKTAGKPELYVYGTNLSTHFSEVFSVEHTPTMPVAEAIRITMSLPVFFASVRSSRQDVYVDGGVLINYPVKLFDREKYLEPARASADGVRTPYYDSQNADFLAKQPNRSPYIYNRETLGFRLDTRKEIAAFRYNEPQVHRIDSFFGYASALVGTILDSQSNAHLHSDDWQRTIYVDTLDVKTTDFGLDDAHKQALEDSGRQGALEYFKWYDDPANQPANRP